MNTQLYQYLWIFLIVGFVGWLGEVCYAAYIEKRFVNRGFLNGPFCPIYGVGIVVIDLFLRDLSNQLFLLFFGAMILGSAIEWIAGFLLEKIFKQKWWDYSDEKFNLNGYICLQFSIVWGFMGMLVVRFIMPLLSKLIALPPQNVGTIVLFAFLAVLLADLIVTTISVLNINRRLELLEAVSLRSREISDMLGNALAGGVLDLMAKYEESELKQRYDELSEKGKRDFDEIKAKYNKAIHKNVIVVRILNAFPKMKSLQYESQLEALKIKMMYKKNKTAKKNKR